MTDLKHKVTDRVEVQSDDVFKGRLGTVRYVEDHPSGLCYQVELDRHMGHPAIMVWFFTYEVKAP